MSAPNDASTFVQYDPNIPKKSKPRRNWASPPLPVPTIAPIPSNAAEYRLSPSDTPLSPLQMNTNTPLNNFFEPLGSPYSPTTSLSSTLRQLHLSAQDSPELFKPSPRLSKWDHVTAVLTCISEHFPAFGDFAEAFTENIPRGDADPRSEMHIKMLSSWLGGRNRFGPVDLTQAMYRNRLSVPRYNSVHADELAYAFDAERTLSDIHFARIGLSIWATQLVGKRCAAEVGKLGKEDSNHPELRVHLRASANQRMKDSRTLVNENDVFAFSMQRMAGVLKKRACATWYLTECMAATRVNGEVVVRDKRPHPLIQAASISAFALCRNKSANGYLALPIAVWLFSCKAHSDIKRVFSRLGLAVDDKTAHRALNALGEARLAALRGATAEALEKKEPYCRKVLDNIQQYQLVHEHNIGKKSMLITGTAATAIRLDDCEPGAFNLDDYHDRLVRNERSTLTTEGLFQDVDFEHLHRVMCLHVVRMLCEHVPSLDPLRPRISERFRSDPIQKHRMREGRKSYVVPLGANSHYEMEAHGMKEAQKDFDTQVGYKPDEVVKANILIWDGGDGGSFLSGGNVKRHLFPQMVQLDVYYSFVNRLWTTDIWHVKANMLNVMAVNYYGPKTTKDPSALSRSAAAANLYVPTKPSACNFYPASRAMRTICEAQVLDIWDLHLTEHTGLLPHFEELAARDALPNLDELLEHADTLVTRYMSASGYRTALSSSRLERAPAIHRFPIGRSWVAQAEPSEPDPSTDNPGTLCSKDNMLYHCSYRAE
ncbi:hypothetical protein BDZ89DRAFT_1127021 [Hymenopellis radicata]|nr:hypothetical protein BDZ89DRAFT_1127021 [Hymenopellis radicata]